MTQGPVGIGVGVSCIAAAITLRIYGPRWLARMRRPAEEDC